MLLALLYTGARASELLALEWSDVNLETGEVFIRSLKHGRPRSVVLPRFLLKPLAGLKIDGQARLFALSYNRLGEVWRLYRPVPKPLHCLRHTYAMWIYERTKDIRFTQRALGHKNIQNTMVYADYAYTAAEYKRIMRIR
jgi:integrase/recombinase XerC